MSDKEIPPINTENKEQELSSPDIFPEKKDLNTLQTKVETDHLKDEVVDSGEVDNDWGYEIIKGSKMYDKLLTILGTEDKVETFALDIDKVVRKYLDQELEGFSNSIKNSMSVGIQFAMMETLIKQGAQGSTQFFDAFTSVKSKSSSKAFEGLYKAFGTLGSANEFYILANKVQNITRYLADKKNIIYKSGNIPELINPNQFKLLLNNSVWLNQKQIDTTDITSLLTLNSTSGVDIHTDDDELKKIVNNDALLGVITNETITSIQKSLKTADKLLDSREKFKTKTSDLISSIAGFLDINIPFLGNLGEMIGMEFPTDVLGEKKDGGVLNFVLGVLGFHGGVQGLHKEYIREKLDELHIDNSFIITTYTDFQKNKDTTISHDSSNSIWKICGLSVFDDTIETTIKSKLPTDYMALKTSLVDNLDTATLNPGIVAKFAPEIVGIQNDLPVVDISKIKDNKDTFVDNYLKYIIPLLVQDDFMISTKTDKDFFVLAVIGGLIGDKYFIEGINIGLFSPDMFISPTSLVVPEVPVEHGTLNIINGTVDFSKGKFTPEQIININFLINEMNTRGITDPNTQIGILSVIGKESGFIPKNENSYANTPNQDIRKIFGNRVSMSDSELTELKKNPEQFFNRVYASTVGNQGGNDGRIYRGRGYNQLTGKDNYKTYAEFTGTNILQDPDSLNDPIVAAKIALAFFTQKKNSSSFPSFSTKHDAAIYFADINAGNRPGKHRSDALEIAKNFDIQTSIA